jgi:hypothetical protein
MLAEYFKMQKPHSYTLLTLLIALTFGCGTTEYLTSKRNISEVKHMLLFQPVAEISVIYNGDNYEKSEQFSDIASHEIVRQLNIILPDTIGISQFITDSIHQNEINNSAIQIIRSVEGGGSIKGLKVSELLLHQLDSTNQEFGLYIFIVGFTRTKENLTKQYMRRKGIGLATLGFYQTVPNSSYSTMIGFIIDRKNKNLAMYRKIQWNQRDPTDKLVVKSQLRDLLMRYFQSAK